MAKVNGAEAVCRTTAFTFEHPIFDYYRFPGYSLRFQHIDGLRNDRVFYPGVSFMDIVGINDLDKEDG